MIERLWQHERERLVLWWPVLAIAGVAAYFSLPVEPWAGWGPIALLSASLAAFACRRHLLAFVIAVGLAGAAFGWTVSQLRVLAVEAPMLDRETGSVALSGQVTRVEPRGGTAARLVLEHVTIDDWRAESTPRRVRVHVADASGISIGDVIEGRAVLRPPPPPALPGGYDFQRAAFFDGIGAVGFTLGRPDVQATDDSDPLAALQQTRLGLTEAIRAALPEETGAVAAALVTGQRGAIGEDVVAAMRDSGLAHLLAISGLHIGIVAGFAFFLARAMFAAIEPLALRRPIKSWAAAAAIVVGLGYMLIAGATVPTQRAFLMAALAFGAIMLGRSPLSLRLVAAAALAVLVLSPESVLGPSFQLSFAAVTALVAAFEWLRTRPRLWPEAPSVATRIGAYIGATAVSTIVATLATAPFAIFHFDRFAVYGLLANLIAVPLTAFWIMPFLAIGAILVPLGLEDLPLMLAGWGVDLLLTVARLIASWPQAVVLLPAMPPSAMALIAAGGLWLCLWRSRWRLLGGAAIAGGLAIASATTPPDIYAAGNARLFALRPPDGRLLFSTTTDEAFMAEMWARANGQRDVPAWSAPTDVEPMETPDRSGDLACDAWGCVSRGPPLVAFSWSADSHPDDCARADIVITTVPMRWPCRGPTLVIDRFDLAREGTHLVWWRDGQPEVLTTRAARGDRPWTVTNR